jgi:hypothetical protein
MVKTQMKKPTKRNKGFEKSSYGSKKRGKWSGHAHQCCKIVNLTLKLGEGGRRGALNSKSLKRPSQRS